CRVVWHNRQGPLQDHLHQQGWLSQGYSWVEHMVISLHWGFSKSQSIPQVARK
ncbi:hypothetical protein HAX54_004657, partial [Datura stramonium]|nr:hypothetical protein [Datura stramonium]